MDELDQLAVMKVLWYLDPWDVASLALQNRHLRDVCYDDALWMGFCKLYLACHEPLPGRSWHTTWLEVAIFERPMPTLTPAKLHHHIVSSLLVWQRYRDVGKYLHGALFGRMKRAFDTIVASQRPTALLPGASEEVSLCFGRATKDRTRRNLGLNPAIRVAEESFPLLCLPLER
jgi:hypothetical protein